jgi:hypothetical protein
MWYRWTVATEAFEWLLTPEASAAARRELGRLRLPSSLADDALQDARVRAWRLASDRGRPPPDNPAAAAYRLLQYAVRDLYRRGRARPEEAEFDEAVVDAEAPPFELDVVDRVEDDCRRVLLPTLAATPWIGAAVLNELTFRLHRDVPIPDAAPAPRGSTDEQNLTWAALWLAGKVGCFPSAGRPEDAAMRQRRARALKAASERLRWAVETAKAVT